jgi:hypothetical protein
MPITKASGNAVTAAAKGDLVVGSATNDSSVLAVGANNTVLTADSTTATGLKWAAPATGGGMTLLSTTSLSGATVTLSSIDQTYTHLELYIFKYTNLSSNGALIVKPNGNNNVQANGGRNNSNSAAVAIQTDTAISPGWNTLRTNADNAAIITIYNYAETGKHKNITYVGGGVDTNSAYTGAFLSGIIKTDDAITSVDIFSNGGDFNGGTVKLYGVK